MTRDELIQGLTRFEDNFIERKPETANSRELRRTIVAFANSVPDDRDAVLYIGIDDHGNILGVSNPDKKQKDVREICDRDCYPAVNAKMEVLSPESDKSVVAVVIRSSEDRPHFSGPAFVRRGSESVAASKDVFDELVTSRLSKPREILKWKNKDISVTTLGRKLGRTQLNRPNVQFHYDCRVIDCTPHTVTLNDLAIDERWSEPLEEVKLAFDESKQRLKLIVG